MLFKLNFIPVQIFICTHIHIFFYMENFRFVRYQCVSFSLSSLSFLFNLHCIPPSVFQNVAKRIKSSNTSFQLTLCFLKERITRIFKDSKKKEEIQVIFFSPFYSIISFTVHEFISSCNIWFKIWPKISLGQEKRECRFLQHKCAYVYTCTRDSLNVIVENIKYFSF